MVYSEHLIARVRGLVQASVDTGAALEASRRRPVVTVGRVVGPLIGCNPNDAALTWTATTKGSPAPLGSRGAVHLLPDGRTGLGLGAGRGVIESGGYHLVVVTHPEPGRYSSAWRLPGVSYGGLV